MTPPNGAPGSYSTIGIRRAPHPFRYGYRCGRELRTSNDASERPSRYSSSAGAHLGAIMPAPPALDPQLLKLYSRPIFVRAGKQPAVHVMRDLPFARIERCSRFEVDDLPRPIRAGHATAAERERKVYPPGVATSASYCPGPPTFSPSTIQSSCESTPVHSSRTRFVPIAPPRSVHASTRPRLPTAEEYRPHRTRVIRSSSALLNAARALVARSPRQRPWED